jgi:pimeloyl-ACP methyl ester carboxylesterase
MKEGKVNVRDGNMFYRVQGEGEPLILIHSMGLSSELWLTVMDDLSKKFTVYAPDLIGHGDSDKPDLKYEVIDYAKLIVEFMDAMSIKKASLIGSSIGGMISIEVSLNFPERITKQVLVACPIVYDRWKNLEDMMMLGARYDAEGNPIPQRVEQLAFIYSNPTQEIADWTNRIKNKAGKWCKKDQIALALWDPRGRINKINIETLSLYGTKDALIIYEEILLKEIKNCKTARIEGVSHFPQREDPKAFTEAVLKFL